VDVITDLFDVVMLNRYYGWYVNSGDLAAAERALESELEAWVHEHEKPIIITEYGGYTFERLHSILPAPWTEGYQVELLAMYHRVFDRIEAVVGEQVWNFADFATVPGGRGSKGRGPAPSGGSWRHLQPLRNRPLGGERGRRHSGCGRRKRYPGRSRDDHRGGDRREPGLPQHRGL
jgi:hypothetical protein